MQPGHTHTHTRTPLRLAVPLLLLAALLAMPLPATAALSFDDVSTYTFTQEYMLQAINRARDEAGLAPVRLDPLASEAARLHAVDMMENGFFSHWNLAGIKPTRRYNLLGGFDAVGENVYMGRNTASTAHELVDHAMATLLASEGHRKTILGTHYTHVGLGFALTPSGRTFYCAQEFVARRGGDYRFPLEAFVGEVRTVSGRYDPQQFRFLHVTVSFEELPSPRGQLWLNKTGAYKDGDKLIAGYSPVPNLVFNDMETYYNIVVDEQRGKFSCDVLFDYKGKEGTYYVSVWLRALSTGAEFPAATAAVEVRR